MTKKVLVRVLVGVLAVLLVAGLVVQFTPTMGALFGATRETPAVLVNGEAITAEELEAVRRGNPVFTLARDGVLGDDFRTLIVDQKVREVVLNQAASDIRISDREVSDQVRTIREQNALTSNKDWVQRLAQVGLTDAQFREQLRAQLAVQKKAEEIREAAPEATEEEARLYYELNPQAFAAEPRILGRKIVVEDREKAEALREQALEGADFAELARENNVDSEAPEQGGALSGAAGENRPVTRLALPAGVADAAFALTEGGVTDVVESEGKFYVVKVEEYSPAGTRPFEEAKEEALTAVSNAKKNAALQAWVDEQVARADVKVEDPNWSYNNPVVAVVDGQEVRYAEVLGVMISNPQFSQFLQQGGDQTEMLVNAFFKPQVVDALIQQYAAQRIVNDLKLPLAGSREELLGGLQSYGGREVVVTDAEIAQAYEQQQANFQTAASADATVATFRTRDAALSFRQAFVSDGGDFTDAASKVGGTVSELGSVTPEDGKLSPVAAAAVFESDRLATAGEGSVTDVVEVGDRFSVVYVQDLVKAETQPLAAVRDQLREQVLSQKRSQEGQAFLQEQLKKLTVENRLETVLAEQQERVAAQQPAADAAEGAEPEGTEPEGTEDAVDPEAEGEGDAGGENTEQDQ